MKRPEPAKAEGISHGYTRFRVLIAGILALSTASGKENLTESEILTNLPEVRVSKAEKVNSGKSKIKEEIGSNSRMEAIDTTPMGKPDYKIIPEYNHKMSPDELRITFLLETNRHRRHMLALQQATLKNVPQHYWNFKHMSVIGRKGTKVEFDVAKHAFRIGEDGYDENGDPKWLEVPFDGPTAQALADIENCRLADPWMSAQVYEKTRKDGVVTTFYSGEDLAKKAEISNWAKYMLTGSAVIQYNKLHYNEWRENEDRLTNGNYKVIHPPTWEDMSHGRLNMQGGYYADGKCAQPDSHGFHEEGYSDPTHGVLLTKIGSLIVNGEPVSFEKFYSNLGYAREFLFNVIPKNARYRLSGDLQKIVDESPQIKEEGNK